MDVDICWFCYRDTIDKLYVLLHLGFCHSCGVSITSGLMWGTLAPRQPVLWGFPTDRYKYIHMWCHCLFLACSRTQAETEGYFNIDRYVSKVWDSRSEETGLWSLYGVSFIVEGYNVINWITFSLWASGYMMNHDCFISTAKLTCLHIACCAFLIG